MTALRARAYSPAGTIGTKLAKAQRLAEEIQRLEAQLSPLRASLLTHMQKQDLDRIELGNLRVTRKVRHNWSYSAHVDGLSLQLRQLQLDEQVLGVASDRPTTYVAFNVTA
jgi:hypothetical protein